MWRTLLPLACGLVLAGFAHAAGKPEPTPQQQLATTCNYEATTRGLQGQDRNHFVSSCISAGNQRLNEVMQSCNARARHLQGDERRKFLAECSRS